METFKLLKANDAGGDLTKQWYISYHFRNPKTGQFERFRESHDVNRISGAKQRREALYTYKHAKQLLLESGWSPFQDHDIKTLYEKAGLQFTSIHEAIDTVLAHKKLHLQHTSYAPYKNTIETFRNYLVNQKLIGFQARDIGKRHINEFLDFRSKEGKICARTRNNILINLKSLFSCMFDLEIIDENPALRIKKLAQTTEKNEIYTEAELNSIFDWLGQNQPYTLLFCRFIYFTLIRPIELTRLQVKDIDIKNNLIRIPASKSKNKYANDVPIMAIFLPFVQEMKLENYHPDCFLFSARKEPFILPTSRDYFTDKFKNAKKALGLSDNQTMYSLKHTSICQLLRKGAPESEIRKYSRHKTSEAFNAYARSFTAERANDLSNFF